MNKLKAILGVATLATACLCRAQDFKQIDYAAVVRPGSGLNIVASTTIGSLENVLGKGFDLDVRTFAGIGVKDQQPFGGIALTYDVAAAQNAALTIGPAVGVEQGRPVRLYLYAGFTVRL